MFEYHHLRAIVRAWPGGRCEFFLERIDFGDEVEPYIVAKRVQVTGVPDTICELRWSDEGFVLVDDDHGSWLVRASSDVFSDRAVKSN